MLMLKNTRKYLQNEIVFTNEYLKEDKEKYAILKAEKAEYVEREKLAKALEEKKESKFNLLGNIIMSCVFGPLLVYLTIGLKGLPLILSLIGISAVLGGNIGFSIKRVVKAYRLYKDMQEEYDCNFKGQTPRLDKDYHERFFDLSYDERMLELEEKIENRKVYLMALWETLSSEDFISMLEKYCDDYGEYAFALEEEWETYLDEVSKFYPEDVDYKISKEELLKIEPIKLNLTPNCEKSYSLAIK